MQERSMCTCGTVTTIIVKPNLLVCLFKCQHDANKDKTLLLVHRQPCCYLSDYALNPHSQSRSIIPLVQPGCMLSDVDVLAPRSAVCPCA